MDIELSQAEEAGLGAVSTWSRFLSNRRSEYTVSLWCSSDPAKRSASEGGVKLWSFYFCSCSCSSALEDFCGSPNEILSIPGWVSAA